MLRRGDILPLIENVEDHESSNEMRLTRMRLFEGDASVPNFNTEIPQPSCRTTVVGDGRSAQWSITTLIFKKKQNAI